MKSKYKKGERITSLDEMMKQSFIYCHCKVYHCGWFQSWTLRSAQLELQRGVYKAVRLTNREYYGEDDRNLHMKHFGEVCQHCQLADGLRGGGYDGTCCNPDICDEALDNWMESKVK